jgi:TPP-dependent pyruvate/acetoin dehydrogenase alpha subunit
MSGAETLASRMKVTPSSSETAALATDQLLAMLRRMHEIRQFEDETHRLFAKGLVRGSTHLCQGQEAVAVGVCSALDRDDDTMLCTYRGHGAVLAKGAPLDRSFAEILGKADGLCRGKGGSMHLTDVSVGALGSFAIVGAHLPIAVGVAFASAYRGDDAATACFFGDGSTNIGAFHEALNLASLWRLPVVFVIENNLYGEYSPLATTTPIERLADRAASYGMASEQVDGNHVEAVHVCAVAAVARARAGEGPTLVEALTYRHKGHSRSDPAAYRPEGELEAWLERDPLLIAERILRDRGVEQAALETLRAEAARDVAAALERATSWPDPAPEARLEDVHA